MEYIAPQNVPSVIEKYRTVHGNKALSFYKEIQMKDY